MRLIVAGLASILLFATPARANPPTPAPAPNAAPTAPTPPDPVPAAVELPDKGPAVPDNDPPPPVISSTADHAYTAFDLEAGILATKRIPPRATVGPYLDKLCSASIDDAGVLTVSKSKDPRCAAIFHARSPGEVLFDVEQHAPPPKKGKPPAPVRLTLPFVFDRGVPDVFRATFDKPNQRIELDSKGVDGFLVYHSTRTRNWVKVGVDDGIASVPSASEDITQGTKLYLRLTFSRGPAVDVDEQVFEVDWKRPAPPAAPAADTTCPDAIARARNYDWAAFVDSREPNGVLEVVYHPSKLPSQAALTDPFATSHATAGVKGAVIEPNSFGLVVVRHRNDRIVTIDSGPIKLSLGDIFTGVGQSDKGAPPAPAGGVGDEKTATIVCTTHQVGPHAPGPFQVKLAIGSPGETKKISERTLELAVVTRYIGAFRTGLAGILFAPDQSFEARTAPGSTAAEIVQTKATPLELVVGYSVYGSSLSGDKRGRSYFSANGQVGQDGHWGVFLGFGVVSFSEKQVDYLRSLHLGVEYELGPHAAIALTFVLRRVNELAAGAMVGGPAPSTVPTEERYSPGAALVINISPSFFKFPATILQ